MGARCFRLEEGETGALIGPSGCGKTTLMRILAGLDRNFEGFVRVPANGRAGMAFQEPRLLPWRSVEDNVRLAAPDASEAEIGALFAGLGLSEHRTHFPGELSLSLARRASLARAFAVRPTVLLLDEPFASLDAPLARQIQRDLARLVESRPIITVLVTHDVDRGDRSRGPGVGAFRPPGARDRRNPDRLAARRYDRRGGTRVGGSDQFVASGRLNRRLCLRERDD